MSNILTDVAGAVVSSGTPWGQILGLVGGVGTGILPAHLHALLIVLALLWGGCHSIPQPAKPSTPAGVQAPDLKPANDAQAASDAAAQERLSKLSANVNAAATAPNIEASPVAVNELTVARGRLSDVKPDPVEVAAAAERRALVEAGKAAEARQNADAAADQGRTDAARIAQLQATATSERARADAAVAAYAAQAEKNRIENQKAIDIALASAKKARDEQHNAMLRDQAGKLTWIGIGCTSAAVSIAVLVGFFGSILVLRKVGMYLLALAIIGFLFLGAAQIISQPWFMPVCAAVILGGCIWFGVWAWRHQKRGDLNEELAARSSKAKAALDKLVPTIDAVYREGTQTVEEVVDTLNAKGKSTVQDLLDSVLFSKLSAKLDTPEKDTVKQVRDTVDPITL